MGKIGSIKLSNNFPETQLIFYISFHIFLNINNSFSSPLWGSIYFLFISVPLIILDDINKEIYEEISSTKTGEDIAFSL